MVWDVAGLGNALVDALVVVEDDALVEELGLTRGTMHPVDDARWQEVYARVRHLGVTLDSGGSCANTLATVGRLGGRALYCGQVGDDDLGRLYAERMEQACGAHALRVSSIAPTGKCLSIISGRDAERTMLTDLGAAVHLSELGDFADALRQTRFAHFTGYTLLDGPTRPVVLEAMRTAREAGAILSLDTADPFVVHTIRDLVLEVVEEHVDILFVNAEEARGLTDEEPERAIRRLAERHVGIVVVKLGAQGSLVLSEGTVRHVEPWRVRAVDTTGAGDTYAGAFLFGLSRGWDVERAGQLASRVAALTVSQIGAVVKDRAALDDALRAIAPARPTGLLAGHP